MSRMMDHQRQWILDLDHLDNHWADSEFRLREQAVALAEDLRNRPHQYDRALSIVSMAGSPSPIVGFLDQSPALMQQRFNEMRFEVYPVGGKEEILLIEECLRRAQAGIDW